MQLMLSTMVILAGMTQIVCGQDIRLNQIQVIGTHNSYHIAPHPSTLQTIGNFNQGQQSALDYTHRPLSEQFSELGIRQIELDVYADPSGGKFSTPKGPEIVAKAGLPRVPAHDPEGVLKQPGLKVLHVPDIDFLTTVKTFTGALKEIKAWSDEHPAHVPIMILVEVKQNQVMPGFTQPHPFDGEAFDTIDREILAVFARDKLITPDGVRGDKKTLREAVLARGWPSLADARGKVMFALDNGGRFQETYLKGHPSLKGRMLFVSVDESHPAAAFMKLNDPIGQFEHIQSMVKKGYLVRTRADSNTAEARSNDTTKREKAFASGAQFISTDYPEPDSRLSAYCVRFDGGVARANPVNGDGSVIVE